MRLPIFTVLYLLVAGYLLKALFLCGSLLISHSCALTIVVLDIRVYLATSLLLFIYGFLPDSKSATNLSIPTLLLILSLFALDGLSIHETGARFSLYDLINSPLNFPLLNKIGYLTFTGMITPIFLLQFGVGRTWSKRLGLLMLFISVCALAAPKSMRPDFKLNDYKFELYLAPKGD